MADSSQAARQKFEKWGNAKGAHVERSWNGEYYENRLVESAWQGWQAALDHFPGYAGWISVGERLPEVGGTYLVRVKQPDLPSDATDFGFFVKFEDGPKWSITGVWPDKHEITHWMPLPHPPKPVRRAERVQKEVRDELPRR